MHGRDQRELIENLVATDVARMKNEIDTCQRGEDIGTHHAVRI